MTSCTSILRIGGPLGSEASISIIKSELSNHFSYEKAQEQLHISNKYFTATVRLCPIQGDGEDHGDTCGNVKEDGVMLVLPSSTDIEALTDVHDAIQSNIGDTLRLCISTFVGSLPNTKVYQEEYSKRVLWCLDRGYEYIEVDMSEEGLKGGFQDREKDGFARVVEAIGGTVWSSAVMLNGGKQKKVPSVALSSGTVSDVGLLPDQDDAAKEIHPHDSISSDKKVLQESTSCKNNSHDDNNAIRNSSDPDEAMLDHIEQIMDEARRIRESSKMGQLCDEERRKRAGNAAEVLMGLLNQMGLDDDDDDEDNDDDDDSEIDEEECNRCGNE